MLTSNPRNSAAYKLFPVPPSFPQCVTVPSVLGHKTNEESFCYPESARNGRALVDMLISSLLFTSVHSSYVENVPITKEVFCWYKTLSI